MADREHVAYAANQIGYGDGSGYGSGSGSGYGSGDGYGDGYGFGSGYEYLLAIADSIPRAAELRQAGATIGFWRSGADGRASNGGHHAKSVEVGTIEEIRGPLKICTKNALHATNAPWKCEGERLWIVALFPPVQEQDDKYGSLRREIIQEIVPNPFA